MPNLRPETTKQKIKRTLFILLNIFLFILIVLITLYFFNHSPAIVNKVNNILNHDQQSQDLKEAYNDENILDNTIIIPQINVYAPIVLVSSSSPEEIKSAVTKGIAAWRNNSKLVLAGSYSDNFWNEGNYKYILSALGNLEYQDEIGINLDGEYIRYKVKDIKTIKAKNFSDLNNIDSDLVISCNWPPGLTRYKLVLEADKLN